MRCEGGEGVVGAVVSVIITDQSLGPAALRVCKTRHTVTGDRPTLRLSLYQVLQYSNFVTKESTFMNHICTQVLKQMTAMITTGRCQKKLIKLISAQ